jgi:glutaredoxin
MGAGSARLLCMSRQRFFSPHSWVRALAAVALLGAAAPGLALYKVVGPDGKVTYTDRPPAGDAGRASSLSNGGVPAAAEAGAAGLPVDVRQAAARFPVTFYASAECSPCDTGRRLLQQRGVPFTERIVVTEEDADALVRLTGSRTVPSLSVGAQVLRGFGDADWHAYLDAAGYPRESKLPRNFAAPASAPLVERKPEPRKPGAPAAPVAANEPNVPQAPVPTEGPGGIRF